MQWLLKVLHESGLQWKQRNAAGKNADFGFKINFSLENPVSKHAEQRMDKENYLLWIKTDFSALCHIASVVSIPEACTLPQQIQTKQHAGCQDGRQPQMLSALSSYSCL